MPYLSLHLTIALVGGLMGGVLLDVRTLRPFSLVLAMGWSVALLAFHQGWRRAQLAAVMAALAAAGFLLGTHAVDRALHPSLRTLLEQRIGGFAMDGAGAGRTEEPVIVEGRLRTDVIPTATGAVLRIDVERVWLGATPEPAAGGVSVGVSGTLHDAYQRDWTAGRRLRAPAVLRRPARYLNAGVPDLERAMARRGIALVGTVKSASLVEVVDRARWWDEAAARARAVTRAAMARHVAPLDTESAAIATAILIVDRAALDPGVERRLQEAGTYHVIAISGGNIAILAGLVLAVLGGLGVRGRVAALGVIVTLAAYAWTTAGGPSVARATLMAIVYLGVRLIDHRTAAANAIALSAALLLLVTPLAVADVGFWLSFGATAAILVGASRVTAQRTWVWTTLAVLLATVCSEIALAPIAAAVFQRVTLAGLALNFIAIPCMTLVQVAALAVVALDVANAGWLAGWAALLAHLGARALVDSTALLDLAPWLAWRVPPPAVAAAALYYAALIVWWRARRPVLRRAAAAAAGVLFVWIVTAPAARVRALGDGRLHVTAIDVGQGDALLVTFPDGRRLVVDTGGITVRGEFDMGERVVAPALRARGVLRLDYVAVTHGDPDHAGGARTIVRDFQPAEVWWGPPVPADESEARLRAEARRSRTAWRTLQRGDRLEIGGVALRVHHPPPPDWERQKVRNDDSLVLELRLGDVSVVLTGDIGREVEHEILPALDLGPRVVLKVPHHGSATSSSVELVETLRPAVALVGVGRGNLYGHPVPRVLERYRQVGTELFRTDLDGQVDVVTDGTSIDVTTYTGRRWSTTK